MGKVNDAAVLIAFVQGIVGPFHEDLGPLQNRGSEKSGNRAENDLLKKSGMHLRCSGSRRDASFEWDYQNPHCFVFMIQSPRSRFVMACANMQEERLFVR